MDSKTRSKLNGMAMKLQPLVIIGKNGITDSVLKELDTLLELKELVKVQILKNSDLSPTDIIGVLSEALNAEQITAIGSKLVLYRYSKKEGIKHILNE